LGKNRDFKLSKTWKMKNKSIFEKKQFVNVEPIFRMILDF